MKMENTVSIKEATLLYINQNDAGQVSYYFWSSFFSSMKGAR